MMAQPGRTHERHTSPRAFAPRIYRVSDTPRCSSCAGGGRIVASPTLIATTAALAVTSAVVASPPPLIEGGGACRRVSAPPRHRDANSPRRHGRETGRRGRRRGGCDLNLLAVAAAARRAPPPALLRSRTGTPEDSDFGPKPPDRPAPLSSPPHRRCGGSSSSYLDLAERTRFGTEDSAPSGLFAETDERVASSLLLVGAAALE